MARVTQKTIAAKLGLSPSLVSRALSGKAEEIGCTPETTARIVAVARALGYVPSAAARQLRGRGGPVIGVMVSDMGDPFFAQVMTEVIRQAHARGYALAVAGFNRRMIDQRDLTVLLEQDLAGLLMIGGGSDAGLAPVQRRKLPAVRIGSILLDVSFAQVGPDEAGGFRKLMHHLSTLGHKRLGFVGADQPVHRERLRLAQGIARSHGMTCNKHHAVYGPAEVLKAGLEGGRRLLDQTGADLPSAVVCSSDAVAMGVMGVLTSYGLRIPRDISVTGFDDLLLSQLASPPLTTLHQPVPEMTAWALDALFNGGSANRVKRLPLGLMARGSTSPRSDAT